LNFELTTLLGPLQALASFFQKERHYDDSQYRYAEARRREALQAMYSALIATRMYVESIPSTPDRQRELELSELWATAAIKSRGFVDVMVSANQTKARYYADKLKWSRDEVLAKGIDLSSMEEKISRLITEK
jgi:hypothetical protein